MNRAGFLLFIITVFLSAVGIFILYESSSYTAMLNIGDKYYFVKNQTVWLVLGIFLSLLISKIEYKKLYNLALPSLIVTILLLLLVFIPGIGLELKGSHRWIDLRFIVFQPSELLKISLTLYLAAWLSNKEEGRLLAFMIIFALCTFLVVIQPDMGTSFIIAATSIIIYFLANSPIRDMIIMSAILVMGIFIFIKAEPYRVSRLESFREFDHSNISKAPYHIKQILIALGSGGVSGVGIGKSVQKYAYLPENTTDSIFAIYAEETGFIGSVFLISLFLFQSFLGFLISLKIKDKFGKLLASGIIAFLSIQAIVNIASQAVLVPLTGVPLPFVSYGGSSMLINFASIGILMNISRHIK
ncbi:hypothetical protein C4577_02495 [Candidatus Parcubacteria bacterium]|nr:MAG: hypothetical protein C4577_02495 [Candidatus Parcubacteria bacterium]